MVEKKLVIDALRFNYTGMFDIEEFFKEIADWTKENGYERDTKKKKGAPAVTFNRIKAILNTGPYDR